MPVTVDLHSHSGYAGGAGQISLSALAETMRFKWYQVYGVGDCLFPAWQKEYQQVLTDTGAGLYLLPGTNARFIRQTEVILTAKLIVPTPTG